MVNWLRFSVTCSLAMIPTLAHAEVLKFLCSLSGEYPIAVTVDGQARTISADPNRHDLGPHLKVLKITKEAVWLILHEADDDGKDLEITSFQRSSALPDRNSGGVLRTIVVAGGEPILTAPPAGVCWELVAE